MQRRSSGIGLVDFVIIFAVLGLLAVVGLPSLSRDAPPKPDEFTLLSRLVEMRLAVDTYWAEHKTFPGQAGPEQFTRQLVGTTNASGEVGEGPEFPHGPYLLTGIPDNPFQGVNSVRVVSPLPGDPEGGEAWLYDPKTGQVRANVQGTVPGGDRLFDL
jgi:hypothetical protein